MAIRFTVLASGSAGNTTLARVEGFGLLIDVGLGPRLLATRLAAVGASWADIQAVLLTHTHGDHWKERTLAHLRRRDIPFYCHADHAGTLLEYGTEFAVSRSAGLVRHYEAGQEFELAPGLRCRPLPVMHDGGPCFGFRLEQEAAGLFGDSAAVGYAADLGSWTPALAQALADVDVLALEFNHDVTLEQSSGRSYHLIRRVLGERGHLSNDQAAALVEETQRRSTPGRLRHLVQLHLSRDCNRPRLARLAARGVLGEASVEIHTAGQDEPGATLIACPTHERPREPRPRGRRPLRTSSSVQPWLPGLEP